MSLSTVRSLVRSAAAAAFALGAVASASADANDPLADPGWRPWLSVGFDIHSQGVEAGFSSDSVPTLGGGTRSSDAAASTDVLTAFVTLEAAVDAPRLAESGWVPRPFAHIGVQIPTKGSFVIFRRTGSDGDPSLGRIAEHSYSFDLVASWYAGLGMAWAWPVAGRHFSLRPSIDYWGERVDWQGSSALGERDPANTPPGSETPLFAVSASRSATYHALGPRLAGDVLLGRRGRVGLGLYAQVQFYWILSERVLTLAADNEIGSGSAAMRFEKDPLVAQGGVGFRLTWLPK